MPYWYIWYEIYEDDKLIENSRGRYSTGYKHKSSAVRRAKQMWSEDLYNPMTDTTITRKWIVSKANPWEDVYIFKTKRDAEIALWFLRQMIATYACATRADLINIMGGTASYFDTHYGWINVKNAKITSSGSVYLLEMPRALPLQ